MTTIGVCPSPYPFPAGGRVIAYGFLAMQNSAFPLLPSGEKVAVRPDEGARSAAFRASGHPLIASHPLGTSPRWGEEAARGAAEIPICNSPAHKGGERLAAAVSPNVTIDTCGVVHLARCRNPIHSPPLWGRCPAGQRGCPAPTATSHAPDACAITKPV